MPTWCSGVHTTSDSWPSFRESLVFVAGSVPPVLVLLATQQAMFGNPFLPGQYWMPAVNYTDEGFRGFSYPNPELFWRNFFDLRWGMFIYTPLLILAFLPARLAGNERRLIMPRLERRYLWILIWATIVFNAANQYSFMQWNTGFRYMMVLLPFLTLFAADHLVRLPKWWFRGLMMLSLLNGWVVGMYREQVPFSWSELWSGGPMLPWFNVLRMTSPEGSLVQHPWLPTALVIGCVTTAWLVWQLTARWERTATDLAPSGTRMPPSVAVH